MSDEWWKCIIESRGKLEQLDEAQNAMSQAWGLRFQHGLVSAEGADLRTIRTSQPWLKACEEIQDLS